MSLAHSPSIVTNGLVLYLDAANKKSYPGSGTTWVDVSGAGNNLTFSGTPTFSNNLFNNGGTVYASRPYIPLTASNEYTLEVLFKFNSFTANTWQNIIQNGVDSGGPNRIMAWYNLSTNNFSALFHTPNSYNNISDTLTTNAMYYLQMVFSPTSGITNGRRAWLNGVEKIVNNTAAGNPSITAGSFFVGYNTSSIDIPNASYSVVRMYNRALSAQEVQQNFNALRGRYGI